MRQSWWGGPLVRAGPPGPALRSRNQDPGIGDRPARASAADWAGVRISARRDLAAELPVRRSVLDGNRQILGDQPGAISHKAVWAQLESGDGGVDRPPARGTRGSGGVELGGRSE